jgi:thiamine biosynthesis lipoprotein
MKETRIIMGMHITVEIVDKKVNSAIFEEIFNYFSDIDKRFSTYKNDSEIMRINRGEVASGAYSRGMQEVFALAEKTKGETHGYFDIRKPNGTIDPSGIVKGWAIQKAAELLIRKGYSNFYIDAGGDIQSHGVNSHGKDWSIGIRSPFRIDEIVKVVHVNGKGVATSGSYLRGEHIYDPHDPTKKLSDVVSLTVVGPNVLEAEFCFGKRHTQKKLR